MCCSRKPECDLQFSRINKPFATVELTKPNSGHFERNHTALRTPLERPRQSNTTVRPKLFVSCDTHAHAKSMSKINQSKKLRRLHRPFQAKSRKQLSTQNFQIRCRPRGQTESERPRIEAEWPRAPDLWKQPGIEGESRVVVTLWRGSLLAPSINRNNSSPRARLAPRGSLHPLARWDSRARLGRFGSNRRPESIVDG